MGVQDSEAEPCPEVDRVRWCNSGESTVKVFRRAAVALVVAGLVAAALRVRGRGGVPPQSGGWQELPLSDAG